MSEYRDQMVVKIQPYGKYRIISIATDGKKHEWNLTITPDKNAWTLAHTEVCVGDYIKGFLIKEVYEISESPEKSIDRKIVNSQRWIKVHGLFERRFRKTTQNRIDPSFNYISGIYRIKNEINGNFYIGRSENVGIRWRKHIKELREGIHHNRLLQEDWWWSLNGKFLTFELLERCDPYIGELVEVEQDYLDHHFGKPNCYNLYPYAYDEPWYIEEVNKTRLKKKY